MYTCASHARASSFIILSCLLSIYVDCRTYACDAVNMFHVRLIPFLLQCFSSVVSPSPSIVDRCIVHAYALSCVCLRHLSCCLFVLRIACSLLPLSGSRTVVRMSVSDSVLSGTGSVASRPDPTRSVSTCLPLFTTRHVLRNYRSISQLQRVAHLPASFPVML